VTDRVNGVAVLSPSISRCHRFVQETPDSFPRKISRPELPKNFPRALVDDNGADVHAAYTLSLAEIRRCQILEIVQKCGIDDADWRNRGVEYIDVNETRTFYSLKDVRFNAGIRMNGFVFVVPEHVEVC